MEPFLVDRRDSARVASDQRTIHRNLSSFIVPEIRSPQRLSCREAQEDLIALVRLLVTSHPDPYSRAGGPIALHRRVQQALGSIPSDGLDLGQLLDLLRPLLAVLGDTHTAIWEPESGQDDIARERLWLDWDVVEESLYVRAVYHPDHRRMLGARLIAVNDVPVVELHQRMADLRGADNVYTRLAFLAGAMISPALLPLLLRTEGHVDGVTIDVRLPSGEVERVTVSPSDAAPGPAIEPPSAMQIPATNAASMAWSRLDGEGAVAYLRIGSLARYRESFEQARSLGIVEALGARLREAARDALGREPPDSVDGQIEAVPAASELLTDLFGAMRSAKTRTLLVDVRDNPGGDSLAALILEYMLYGTDAMVAADDGYQIRRYSALYLENYQGLPPEKAEHVQHCLRTGGYDFAAEAEWERWRREGLTHDVRSARRRELDAVIARSPTFARLVARGVWDRRWTPQVVALTSARTGSAAFDLVLTLVRHGAALVGVPSGQAPNCFIDGLIFTLPHSRLRGQVAYKRSLSFPDEPERGDVLRPDVELTYDDLVRLKFDPNASVVMALDQTWR